MEMRAISGKKPPPYTRASESACRAKRAAGTAVTDFFSQYQVERGRIVSGSITARDLLPQPHLEPRVTPFSALHDTWQFSRLVHAMLRQGEPPIRTIIDLGAGSSIPTIYALLCTEGCHVRVQAIDTDEAALGVSRSNVEASGLSDRYEFIHAEMIAWLSTQSLERYTGVVANPPYLPVPSGTTDPRYAPVDGGEDGTKYLAHILQHPMPIGTYLALEWCSLSHPERVIALIEQGFDVVHVQANDIDRGIYTEDPHLKPHLLRQHKRGEAALIINEDGSLGWTFIGTVLRKR
ncbi:MAG: methyltransferase [Deltaproteobacteria bacterium]|nr:methyltransferase [Deltaproteobacteria bacterium]